jgi:exonuclease VII small subunit
MTDTNTNIDSSGEKPNTSRLYAEHYAILRDIAEKLRTGGPEDVDMIVELFRKAMSAYDVCSVRINAIRKELDRELTQNKPF